MRPIATLIALFGTVLIGTLQVDARSPRLNETWRQIIHNSYWYGIAGADDDPLAGGPKQYFLDDLYIDRARGLEFDLHSVRDQGSPGYWLVYHTTSHSNTLCHLLDDCLKVLRAWHYGNPFHDVMFIHLEAKAVAPEDSIWVFDPAHLDLKLTPEDLDATIVRYLGDDRVFGPRDYYDWCATRRLPEVFPPPGTPPSLDLNNLKDAVAKCGWPTMEELRGKFMVTLHGSFPQNFNAVWDYSHKDGRIIGDKKIFPMASAIGIFALGFGCDSGSGLGASNGVCDWNDHSVFLDVPRCCDAVEFPGDPFNSDPTAAVTDFVRKNGLVRSQSVSTRAGMVTTIDAIQRIPDLHGVNLIQTDAPRNYLVYRDRELLDVDNDGKQVLDWSSGCLFEAPGSSAFFNGCDPAGLTEVNSGIYFLADSPSAIPGLLSGRTSDAIAFVYADRRSLNQNGAGDFKAFVSTRT